MIATIIHISFDALWIPWIVSALTVGAYLSAMSDMMVRFFNGLAVSLSAMAILAITWMLYFWLSK